VSKVSLYIFGFATPGLMWLLKDLTMVVLSLVELSSLICEKFVTVDERR
jgi:hypothetical protein